jgi:hypothetical protein
MEPVIARVSVVAVILRVCHGGLRGVVVRMMIVPGRQMRVMACLEMVTRFVVLRGLLVVSRRVLVVLGGLVVMLSGCFRHTFHQFRSRGAVARVPHDEEGPADRNSWPPGARTWIVNAGRNANTAE